MSRPPLRQPVIAAADESGGRVSAPTRLPSNCPVYARARARLVRSVGCASVCGGAAMDWAANES